MRERRRPGSRATTWWTWRTSSTCDVADVAPDMTARYEFEIDTTRAVAAGRLEVSPPGYVRTE